MFVTDAVTLQDVADALQQVGVGTLPAYVADVNTMEHARAYNEIVAVLAGRGFLLSQITACDLGPYWERSLTVYRVLTRCTRVARVPKEVLEPLNVLGEVRAAEVTAAGVWQAPQGTAGQVGSGPLAGQQVLGPSDRCPGLDDLGGW